LNDAVPRLCVAFATRDRRTVVVQTLASVASQLRDEDDLIVVNNGSQDGTPETVRQWLDEHYPSGRLVDEPEGGASAARNAILRQATAPIVCIVDDDVRAHPDWLEALRRAWAASGPRVGAIGGPIRVDWEEIARPPWLADYLLYVISVLALGPARRRLDVRSGERIWGANMSFRLAAVQEVGGFDEKVGARPDAPYGRDEEEELQHRLAAAGWEVWYEPAAAVDHLIGPDRVTTAYFRAAFRKQGLRMIDRGSRRISALPVLARAIARYVVLRLIRSPAAVTATFTLARGWSLLTGRTGRMRGAAD
jgi:glucosyl-dolichyl phosphate glucuronosyltransferase